MSHCARDLGNVYFYDGKGRIDNGVSNPNDPHGNEFTVDKTDYGRALLVGRSRAGRRGGKIIISLLIVPILDWGMQCLGGLEFRIKICNTTRMHRTTGGLKSSKGQWFVGRVITRLMLNKVDKLFMKVRKLGFHRETGLTAMVAVVISMIHLQLLMQK